MNTRPRLTRSIPFWVLVAGSLASSAAGAVVLIDKLGTMETALNAGTATGVEVYVGQVWAILGAILIGVGVIGLLLAFTLGALRAFATPREQLDTVTDPVVDDVETDSADASATTEQPVLDGASR
ncbi:dinucleotide-utilizing enzyme [Microbacterium sp. NPDC091382]|uniref:dinucleotide-utilizing enzyme n=1 Tax=Microbacterium sp. NPDC091382 TaxID=3364210 RepID=UPI00380DCA56